MPATNQWCLPSNSGWNNIKFEALVLHEPINLIEYSIDLTGQFWYRPRLYANPPGFEKLVDDFLINLPSVLVPKSASDDLLIDFNNWLDSQTPFTRAMSSTPDQVLILQVGVRDGSITTPQQPALSFSYDAGGCRVEVFFGVDQSCMRIARDGLAQVLKALQGEESG